MNILAPPVITKNYLADTITLSFFPSLINFHCTLMQFSILWRLSAEFWCSFLCRLLLCWTMPCSLEPPQCSWTFISMRSVPMLRHFSCVWLCNPMDSSLPGSTVLGLLQARILEWAAMPSSWGPSWPKDWTCVSCISCIAGRFFTYVLNSVIFLCPTWDRCLCTVICNMSLGIFVSYITCFPTLGNHSPMPSII